MKKLILTFILFIFIHIIYGQMVNFETKIFLEGAFNGIDMNTDLYAAGIIPIGQPYNIEPWNYEGIETITAPPEIDIVDWVLIELRETDGDSSTTSPDKFLDHQAALLLSDGSIVQPDGISLLNYSGPIAQNLYIIVYHRNHLPVMSAAPLVNIGDTYEYDFTDAISKAYLNGQKELGGGIYGMIGGNSDGNRTININDIDISWSNDAGKYGYYGGDANMDTEVNNIDKNDVWEVNKDSDSPVTISCGVIFDDRDGQVYHSVLIGEQCWMVSNLNIGIMIYGLYDQIDNDTIEKYCYNDDTINCDVYGGLYQWDEIMLYTNLQGSQGICPPNWHIPIDDEWKVLEGSVDSQYGIDNPIWNEYGWRGYDAGTNLKSNSGWNASGNGSNLYGFTGLPGGLRYYTQDFQEINDFGGWWLSTNYNTYFSWCRYLGYNAPESIRIYDDKEIGLSIRCIKDY